ncbi:MAG: RNA-binding protein [Chitinivibrionales bacterium]|nr:RNA-binding protein [Chitinivibrionales bacterium]
MNLYVGNLSFTATDEELRQTFQVYGEVISAKVIKDNASGRSKGFGFVEMAQPPQGEAAIKGLDGKQFKGRTIKVNEARPKTEKPTRDSRFINRR